MEGEPGSHVVVPSRPGPLEPLRTAGDRRRDGIDDVLDDFFGEPDDRGPNLADAGLVVGGLALAIAAAVNSWSGALVSLGVAMVVVGLVLPVRWAWRAITHRRRRSAIDSQLAGGVPLRVDQAAVAELVARHAAVLRAAALLDAGDQIRVAGVAHTAIYELATLLRGRSPDTATELEYVAVRSRALAELADAVRAGDAQDRADADARVHARHDVEALGGSSVADAAALVDELRGANEGGGEDGERRDESGV